MKIEMKNLSLEELEQAYQQRDDRLFDFFPLPKKSFPLKEQIILNNDRYNTSELHAKGGAKQIIKVFDKTTGRFIAMAKLLDEFEDNEEKQEQFLREARITSYLSHPNIMPIYDIGFCEDKPYFTMKLMQGASLSDIIRELRKRNPYYLHRYSLSDLIDIYIKICDAIAYAHSRGVVHLDLKPDNIQIGHFGEVVVCDWGIARIINAPKQEEESESAQLIDADMVNNITVSGTLKGTPGYMAPEQIDSSLGEKSEKSDIYALGCILYSLLTQHSPLDTILDINKVLDLTVSGRIPKPSSLTKNIPKSLEAICLKAMSKKVNLRYNSVKHLLKDLRSYQHGFTTEAENANIIKALTFFIKRHKTVSSFLTFIVIGASLFMFNLYKKEKIATRNLALYMKEREVAEFFNQKGLSHILNNFTETFRESDAQHNLKIANYILSKNPTNTKAMGLKGLALFALQDYQNSRNHFISSQNNEFDDLTELCTKQINNLDHLATFKALYANGRVPLISQSFATLFNNEKNVTIKENLLKNITSIFNKGVSLEQIDLKFIKHNNSRTFLSIKGPETITTLEFLRYLEIHTVEIHNIKYLNIKKLNTLPAHKLSLVNTRVESLSPLLQMPNLKQLILDEKHKHNNPEIIREFQKKGIKLIFMSKKLIDLSID